MQTERESGEKEEKSLIAAPFFLFLLSVRPWIYKLKDISMSSGEYECEPTHCGSLATKLDLNLRAWFVYQYQVYNSFEDMVHIHIQSGFGIVQDCCSNVNSVQREIVSLVSGELEVFKWRCINIWRNSHSQRLKINCCCWCFFSSL